MRIFLICMSFVMCCHSVVAMGSRNPDEDKSESQKTQTGTNAEEDAPIKRYVFRSTLGMSSVQYLAYFDVYQTGDINSAIILDAVFVMEKEGVLFIVERKEIEKFEIVADSDEFKITFKEGYVTDPYYKRALKADLSFPTQVVFGALNFRVNFAEYNEEGQQRLSFEKRLSLPNRVERFTPESYRPYISVLARGYSEETAKAYEFTVREPGVLHPVTFEEFFSAKGIEFPGLDNPSLDAERITLKPQSDNRPPSSGYSSSPGFRPSQGSSSSFSSYRIENPEDLKLGEVLKGKEVAVFELMNSTHKPTVTEFVEVMGGWEKVKGANPFSEYFSGESRLESAVNQAVPEVIVQLESAFPNAIYYGLGRDIYLLSDAVDAYYVFHRNEADRIRRLHASHPSFDDNNITEVQRFLESNGFQFNDVADQPPRIIFDITSYSKGFRYSQSSQLMRAAYRAMMAAKVDPQVAFSKVNFVSVSSGANNVEMKPGFDFLDFFENLKVDKDNDGPKKLLRTRDVYGLSYPETWHGIYSRFKTVDGQVVTEPGSLSSASTRLKMLGELWVIAREVQTEDFAEKVVKKAGQYLKAASFEECRRLLD